MGFFKDLKEDSSSALKEDDNKAEDLFAISDAKDETIEDSDSEEFIGDVDESMMGDYLDADSEEVTFEEEAEEEVEEEEVVIAEEKEETPAVAQEPSRDADASQTTIITRGTTINGSIISDCSLDVMGTINGDIECLGKLSISGTVVGNSSAADVYVNTKRLEGNIDSEGTVKIGLGTVVVGDIKAGSGVIAGAVKGDVEIAGPIVIDSTAIIKGNIKAQAVQMNNGAVIQGFCTLSNEAVNIDDIFE